MARTTLTAEAAGSATHAVAGASRERRDRYGLVAAYLGPALLGIAIFSVFPILYNVFMSFTNRNNFHFNDPANVGAFFGPSKGGTYSFIGLDNYVATFWDTSTSKFNTDFFFVMGNTLLYTIVCVALFFVVGLVLALCSTAPTSS